SPTVVPDLDRAVGAQGHVDVVAVAGERLVDGVVDDLPEAVHEAAGVGRPDVHAGPLADGFEPLEDGEVTRGVVRRAPGPLAPRAAVAAGGGLHAGRLRGHGCGASSSRETRFDPAAPPQG